MAKAALTVWTIRTTRTVQARMTSLSTAGRPDRTSRRVMDRAARVGRWLDDRGAWLLAVLFVLVVVGRAYHRLLHPQFWAEDGRIWYAEAHNGGTFALLFQPYAGYLHLLPRLVAWGISNQGPATAAISIYVVWIVIQLWFAAIIWGRRSTIGLWPACLLIALMSVGPYSFELHGNLSNLQWYGAIVLIVLCAAAVDRRLRPYEYATVLLVGLSGPLVLPVTAALAASYALDRRRRDPVFVAILTLCSLAAGYCLIHFGREGTSVDYSWLSYPIVLGKQVVIGGILGMDTMRRVADLIPLSVLWLLGMSMIALLVRGLTAPRERPLRFTLCSMALMIVMAVHLSPVVSDSPVTLREMLTPLAGSRYWFIPALAVKFEWAILSWRTAFRPAAWLIAMCLVYGMVVDYHVGGLPNEAFLAGVAAYDEAPPGRVVTVPIWPPGWSMAIVKR